MNVLSRWLPKPTTEIVVEPMRRRHVPAALAIERVSYARGWSERVFHNELDQVRDGRRYYLTARVGRTMVGYGGLMFVPDEAHVTNIAVAPEQRRGGVATTLLSALATEAINRGVTAWTLEVRASSKGAQELYRRFGFVPAGVRPGYYGGEEDAIVMWCHDIHTKAYAHTLIGLVDAVDARRDADPAPADRDGGSR